MNTISIAAFRRGRKLVLKVEMPEDFFAQGPFLRSVVEPQPFARRFELCYHRGSPAAEPRSGRRVQWEHMEADLPDHVRLLRIHLTSGGEPVEIQTKSKQAIMLKSF